MPQLTGTTVGAGATQFRPVISRYCPSILGWIIFMSRLLPFLSFDIISYAAGINRLRFSVYAIPTLLGVITSTLMLIYVGSSFTVNPGVALALSGVAALLIIGLPILVKRFNWFGLGDFIHVE